MYDPLVAVVVSVPEEHFPDDDELSLVAGAFVCSHLEPHLIKRGHRIPDWIHGGCEEDWGIYLESQREEQHFLYAISFFPSVGDGIQRQMIIQYQLKKPFLKRLFKKPEPLGTDHHLHQTMQDFGNLFSSSRMLTQSQFSAEY